MSDFFQKDPDIILLDYQCTLCENGAGRIAWIKSHPDTNYAEWIRQEVMRNWLIPLIADKYVILITARRDWWMYQTLDRIRETCKWIPHEHYFNPDGAEPPEHKRRVLLEKIFPVHGSPDTGRYLALESNANTRRMYASFTIPAFRIDQPLTELPSP